MYTSVEEYKQAIMWQMFMFIKLMQHILFKDAKTSLWKNCKKPPKFCISWNSVNLYIFMVVNVHFVWSCFKYVENAAAQNEDDRNEVH